MKTNIKELLQLHTKLIATLVQLEEELSKRERLKDVPYYAIFGRKDELDQDLRTNQARIEALTTTYALLKEQLTNSQIHITIIQKDDTH